MDVEWLFWRVVIGQRRDNQEFAGARETGLSRRTGQLAIVTDAVEPAWQKVKPTATVFASLDMTSQDRGAAVLDRRHDLEMMQAQVPGMGSPISGTGSTEEIGGVE